LAASWHFAIFVAVSFLLFLGVLRLALRRRAPTPSRSTALVVAAVVVVGGMTFAKLGATSGFPVWLYYGLPAAVTWLLPPLVFRMSGREIARYLPLALLMAPAIHVTFSLLLGWKEYMPFLAVPSLAELFG
jgi:uncharacterized membrane protein